MGAKENISEEIIARYLAGDASVKELGEVNDWLSKSPAHQAELRAYSLIWTHSGKGLVQQEIVDTDKAWEKLSRGMKTGSRSEPRIAPVERVMPLRRFNYWNAAAVVLIALSVGWMLFRPTPAPQRLTFTSDNSTREVDLPDGSKVFLNHHASVSFDADFAGEERSLVLIGEAFFKVTPDATRPFVVTAGGVDVRVLGTSFNVKSGQSEPVRVDVQEGRVEVSKAEQKVILGKGQSAKVVNNTVLQTTDYDQNALGYHTGIYDFEGSTLKEVVRVLSEGYHTPVELSSKGIADCHYTARFEKKSLESVLEIVAESLQLKVNKEGGRYVLVGDNCK